MFGSIGVMELIIIAGVALMVLGPDKFPEFAKMAARLVRDLRSYGQEIQSEIAKEIKPVQKELNDLRKIDPEKYIDSLVGEEEEEDEEDDSVNLEPDPSTMELYGGGADESSEADEPEASVAEDLDDPNDRFDTYPYEQDGFESEESPERLDG